MAPPNYRLTQDSIDIAVLKTDVAKINDVVDKLDTTIDKMEQLLSQTVKMIDLHEAKFDYQDQLDSFLRNMNEKEKTEQQTNIDALAKRVEAIEKLLDTRFQEIENKIITSIATKFSDLSNTITKNVHHDRKTIWEKTGLHKIASKYYYMALGGIAVIWWAISNSDVVSHLWSLLGGGSSPIGKR